MGANDVPVDADKATKKPAEVRRMKSPSADKLDELLGKIKKNSVPDEAKGPTMSGEGQISSMSMPAGWSREPAQPSRNHTGNYVEFHSDKNPTVKMGTYYRGHRISATGAKRFHEILKAPEHELTDDEYRELSDVLRDKAKSEDFKVIKKKTVNLNGKRILLVEGEFKEIKQNAYAVYVDAEGTGEVVQEIFFQAPEADYPSYFKAAEAAIKSISWL